MFNSLLGSGETLVPGIDLAPHLPPAITGLSYYVNKDGSKGELYQERKRRSDNLKLEIFRDPATRYLLMKNKHGNIIRVFFPESGGIPVLPDGCTFVKHPF